MTTQLLDVAPMAPVTAPFGPTTPGFRDFELGASTLQDALRLAESPGSAASALLLLRVAVLSFLRARLAHPTERNSTALITAATDDGWACLHEHPDSAPLLEQLSAAQRTFLQRFFAQPWDDALLAQADAALRESCRATLQGLAFALGDPLQRQTAAVQRQRALQRLSRVAAVALLLVALAAMLLWGLSRPNLALHKPVLVESPDPELAVDPGQVVDGDRSNLGFVTLPGGRHSVRIDLQTLQTVRGVHVYNRLDCCLDRVAPLSVEVSRDGQHFQQVAHRERRFALWKAKFPAQQARWVRLVHLNAQPFHLSEIEVY